MLFSILYLILLGLMRLAGPDGDSRGREVEILSLATKSRCYRFFSVEMAFLRTLYALFFIEVETRRIHIAKSSRNPEPSFMTQQARNLHIEEGPPIDVGFLIRDRDAKFTRSFDPVFEAEGARLLLTPVRAPNANALAGRWIRAVRSEVPDFTLVLKRRHLDRLAARCACPYNSHRSHRGIAPCPPDVCGADPPPPSNGTIVRREVLAGINEYLAA